jgi:uncharacterized phage-like protein YoqJ
MILRSIQWKEQTKMELNQRFKKVDFNSDEIVTPLD